MHSLPPRHDGTQCAVHYVTAGPGTKPNGDPRETREAPHWTARPPLTWARFRDYLNLDHPATEKDAAGGYAPVRLNGTRRTIATVITRHLLTLDVDTLTPAQAATLLSMLEHAAGFDAIAHTTYTHTQDAPRYRVLVRLSRPMLTSECRPVAQYAIDRLGLPHDCYDLQASYGPERFMYLPSHKPGETFHHHTATGRPLNVDTALTVYQPQPVALSAPSANTETVEAFLNAHQVDMTPAGIAVIAGHARAYTASSEARQSRHAQMSGHLVWVLREARDGMCDARTAVDTLAAVFHATVTRSDLGLGQTRTPTKAATEWADLLNYAVAQAPLIPLGEARARYETKRATYLAGRKP